ncbi:serine hydrolase domain-containing protein [Paractinoplanes atraurantiacus]|uniref:D-alanyl-D-alanine carboxypeptidase n=1 Tax=Paractinoplanes atraurantiacus TaxID=1036182 RepID=A0A285JKZ9_9ACTN|nr:serine hydrolase domain-containing protein [Actinoplanes atraurantiacus]SNY61010.1 D-alanyl-D-alanine carboxypeptidase [Actinoplanes atraurantiacus]
MPDPILWPAPDGDIGHVSGNNGGLMMQRLLDRLVAGGAVGALAELRDVNGTSRASSGVAELGTARPVDPRGFFRIGSVTKVFTATVVLQLVSEGRIALDGPVDGYAPITVRQLLNHTSGLRNYTKDLTTEGILRDRRRRWTPQEIVARAGRSGREFAPGTSRAYNNTGYVLLGMLIEGATGQPYGKEIEARILRPLGLSRTLVRDDSEVMPSPHARAYLPVGGKPVDITDYNPSTAGPAGGLISTAADVNTFFRALLTGDLLGPGEHREPLTTLPTGTPGVEGGLGITRYTRPGGETLWGKEGGFFGYRTWSFHREDCAWQLTVSATAGRGEMPTTAEVVRLLRAP